MTSLSFKTLIDQALELNNMSINKLATAIGVDRPWLQHALVGRRNLGYDNFEKIMNSLNLTEHLNSELREAFAKEYFGDTNFEIIQNSISRIKNMAEFEQLSTFPPEFSEVSSNSLPSMIFDKYGSSEKQKDFFLKLCHIIETELKKDKPVFYTTYSLSIDSVRTIFLHVLRGIQSAIDYKHIIYADLNSTEEDIFNHFLYQYELAGYGYNTYLAKLGHDITSSPMPYFLLTSDTVIFFSEDLQLYIIENDVDRIAYMHNFFKKNFADCMPFCYFMRSKEDFTLFTSLMPHNTEDLPFYFYDLSSNLCMAANLDAEILSDAIPDEIEHKGYFIQGIANFFGLYSQTPHTAIWTSDSLMNFVENDTEICDYHNVTFDILKITPTNKYKMLHKLRKTNLHNISNNFITIPDKLSMPSFFHLNAYSYNLVLGFNFKIFDLNDGHRYVAAAVSQNPIIHKHIKNLSEYIIHSPYVYSTSRNYAIEQIDNAISYYRKKHNFNENDNINC